MPRALASDPRTCLRVLPPFASSCNNHRVFKLVVFGATVVAIVGRWYFTKTRRLKRRIAASPRWPIADLPEDTLGRVCGTARPLGAALEAPLSHRPCVCYVVEVTQATRNSTRLLFTETKGVPFVIEDKSGRAIIDPTGAQFALGFDGSGDTDMFDPATPDEEALLARHGHRSESFMGIKNLAFHESVIEVGERVAVVGSGVREPDPDAPPASAYRAGSPTRLRLTSSARFPLLISDDPKLT
jgi:hypothetical protein